MRFVRAILVPRTALGITSHRRSRIALAILGVTLAASIVPGVTSAAHGRPHQESYLDDLRRHFAIENPGASTSQAPSKALQGGIWDSRLASIVRGPAYVWDGRLAGSSTPAYVWDGRLAA